LIDPNAKEDPIKEAVEEEEIDEELEEEEDDGGAALAASLLQLKEDSLVRFGKIRRLHEKMKKALLEHGHRSKEYIKVRDQISAELLNIRFTARIIERLCDTVRGMVDEVRRHERSILDMCVNKGQMPRQHFIKVFPGNETSSRWIKNEVLTGRPYGPTLARFEPNILEQQHKLVEIQKRIGIPLKDLKDINKQMATEVHQSRPAIPGSHPGGQYRLDEGRGQVRVSARIQVFDLCHLVDSAGDYQVYRRSGAHHPDSGAHDRDDQQDEPHIAADPAGNRVGARSADPRRENGDA
jgi:hypothetical protein